jgi:hypothetical protein
MKRNLVFCLLIGLMAAVGTVSCNKNGCSKKNKTEFSYAVEDSTLSPPSLDRYYDNYTISVFTCTKNESYIEIFNFANDGYSVVGEISGSTFEIPQQDINENVMNFDGSGSIVGDSVFFEYSYLNWFGEPISAFGQGSIQ